MPISKIVLTARRCRKSTRLSGISGISAIPCQMMMTGTTRTMRWKTRDSCSASSQETELRRTRPSMPRIKNRRRPR